MSRFMFSCITLIPARGRKQKVWDMFIKQVKQVHYLNPRKGTETVYRARWLINHCKCITLIPARGRKHQNQEIHPEVLFLVHYLNPRKGTETGATFETDEIQGVECITLIPARGRKQVTRS